MNKKYSTKLWWLLNSMKNVISMSQISIIFNSTLITKEKLKLEEIKPLMNSEMQTAIMRG